MAYITIFIAPSVITALFTVTCYMLSAHANKRRSLVKVYVQMDDPTYSLRTQQASKM